jgi:hypothetical protein
MGWKTINGRRYYYKSERVGGKVRSRYLGAGEFASIMAQIDASERLEQAAERGAEREQTEEASEEERAITQWFDDVQAAADAAMTEVGFHKHRGQWRRRRT